MFQDTAHWKYDSVENIYLPSEQLERLFNRNYDCFQGLSKKEVEKMAGEPTSIFFNETHDWILIKFKINKICNQRKNTGCKKIIFFLNSEGKVFRSLISEMEAP